jgi:hypothetical protein
MEVFMFRNSSNLAPKTFSVKSYRSRKTFKVEKEINLKKKEEEVKRRFRNKLYDRINVSLHTMDIVITVLVGILILLLVFGVYKARP